MIREGNPADREAVRFLNGAAFGRRGEADLVEDLRDDGDITLSLVAVEGERIVGHILFSGMNAPFRAWGLGPVAVEPARQRAGIGSRLVRGFASPYAGPYLMALAPGGTLPVLEGSVTYAPAFGRLS